MFKIILFLNDLFSCQPPVTFFPTFVSPPKRKKLKLKVLLVSPPQFGPQCVISSSVLSSLVKSPKLRTNTQNQGWTLPFNCNLFLVRYFCIVRPYKIREIWTLLQLQCICVLFVTVTARCVLSVSLATTSSSSSSSLAPWICWSNQLSLKHLVLG